MSGPLVPVVTEGAIDAATRALGADPEQNPAYRKFVHSVLEAVVPHLVPAPELPSEPGRLVISAPGRTLREVALRLGTDGYWHTLDGSASYMPPDVEDNGWIPARVVPDDEHGPVAVLRRVAELLGDTATAPTGIRDELLIVIGVCLERVDGDQ